MGQMTGMPMDAVWWALALGACYGGNGTMIGATPNLVVANIGSLHGLRFTFVGIPEARFPTHDFEHNLSPYISICGLLYVLRRLAQRKRPYKCIWI